MQRARCREWFRDIWQARRFKEEIDSHELVLPLVLVSFVTGVSFSPVCNTIVGYSCAMQALDATCYADLATFAANQTGNVIIITVGVAHTAPPGHETRLNAYSLAGYVVSALIAGRLGDFFGPRRRYWIMFNHFTQVALLAVGMGLLYADIVAARSIVMLLIFAATSGVQVAQARTSSVPEIPTGEQSPFPNSLSPLPCCTSPVKSIFPMWSIPLLGMTAEWFFLPQQCSPPRSWTSSWIPTCSNCRCPTLAFAAGIDV
jgi:MFS family permease